jgi:hypothetical protein
VPPQTQVDAPIYPVLNIDLNASQALRAVTISEHSAAKTDFIEKTKQYKEHISLLRAVKSLLCNDAVVGTNNAAENRSYGVQMVTDSLRTIFARMEVRLGNMSADSALILQQWYKQPSAYATKEYFRIANEVHNDLGPSSNQLTEKQRALVYRDQHKLRPEVCRVLDMFDFDHPDEHTHTLAMLEAFVLSKEAIISRG